MKKVMFQFTDGIVSEALAYVETSFATMLVKLSLRKIGVGILPKSHHEKQEVFHSHYLH